MNIAAAGSFVTPDDILQRTWAKVNYYRLDVWNGAHINTY